jgi:hypothetical protein
MTSQSPRIYIYKITFEEVPYYYYGVHKEKKFNEYYMGSPVTHKWCWELYSPKKQILEVFPYTDEGWLEARKVETRIIKPVYNADKWCLNENCGGGFSLQVLSKAGKIGGKKTGKKNYELGLGIHALTSQQKSENCKKGSKKAQETLKKNKTGIYGMTAEERSKLGKINGENAYKKKIGIHNLTAEEKSENGRKGGKISGQKNKENKTGIHCLTKEQMSENGKKGGSISGKIAGKITSSQKWQCAETGHITNAGALTNYQRKRGIDTTKRIRIE